MTTTEYQIAWLDEKVQPPDNPGWKYMPSETYQIKGQALDRLHRLRKLYPGITFSLQRITREIVAQVS